MLPHFYGAKLSEQPALGFAKDSDEVKRSRTLSILASDILQPITSLQGKAFWKAYWEIIQCHYILWKGGIQHGDISVSNLMHRNGTGVVNDFDLARLISPDNIYHRGFDRTGTTPFLSLDLLTRDAQAGKVERRYRHDLESFLWVLMWVTACYDDGERRVPNDYLRWLNEDLDICHSAKEHQLRTFSNTLTSSYKPLLVAVDVLKDYWNKLYFQQQQEIRSVQRNIARHMMQSRSPDASSSKPVEELPDEKVLFRVLQTFTSHQDTDIMKSDGLLDDLPFTLFDAQSL